MNGTSACIGFVYTSDDSSFRAIRKRGTHSTGCGHPPRMKDEKEEENDDDLDSAQGQEEE